MFGVLGVFATLVALGTGAGLWSVFISWQKQMIDRSQFVAEMVDKKVDEASYVEGMLIGLDTLPDKHSLGIRARLMPWEASALYALDRAWRKWSSHWAERADLAEHTGPVVAVTFSLEGKRVLTGSWDNTARLWDAATGAAVATLEGHRAPVCAVAFSPDGKRVLTGSADKTARLWDAATGAAVATLQGHTNYVVAAAFSPDGKRVLAGSRDKTAKLWSAFPSAQAVIDVVKASVPRCLTPRSASVFICERCRDGAMPATYGLTLTTDRRKRRLQPTLRPFPADLG
jgi:hypothetical protein